MWLRFRHQFADGGFPDDPWEWLEISDTETPEGIHDILLELKDEYAWSDHYRGIEYAVTDTKDQE